MLKLMIVKPRLTCLFYRWCCNFWQRRMTLSTEA